MKRSVNWFKLVPKLISLAREGDASRGPHIRASLRFGAIYQFQNKAILEREINGLNESILSVGNEKVNQIYRVPVQFNIMLQTAMSKNFPVDGVPCAYDLPI